MSRFILVQDGNPVYDSAAAVLPPIPKYPAALITPAWTSWQQWPGNPIVNGDNIYAPCCVQNPLFTGAGEQWYLYFGGWMANASKRDRIYMVGTQDQTLRTWNPLATMLLDVDVYGPGIYDAMNDPSVAVSPKGQWLMACTGACSQATGKGTILLFTSMNGVNWKPVPGPTRNEIQLLGASGAAGPMARPTVSWSNVRNRWELFFDGQIGALYAQWAAFCPTATNLIQWSVIGPVNSVPWFDADFKDLKDGKRYCVYRRNPDTLPWSLMWGVSTDGFNFTEGGTLLTTPAGVLGGLTNGNMVVDKGGLLRAVMYGVSPTATQDSEKIGVAYPA